jgi:gliding motility-associated-like protein
MDSIIQCVEVIAPYTFYIPNAFTPNGDNFNEMFLGYGMYIKDFHIWIFDRWGNVIFESTDIYKGWDGKVAGGASGNIAQQDVYVWKVKITDTNLKKHEYIGHVSLIK